jgi:myo-inositol-1-phosphate synthase
MSPTALNTPGHNDSFVIPPATQSGGAVHATAKRAPEGGLIKVESATTEYTDEGIKARFVDRGANVVSESGTDLGWVSGSERC